MPPFRLSLMTAALIAAAVCLIGTSPAAAQDRTERVSFAARAKGTDLSDRIVGSRGVNYLLSAAAGQKMTVAMTSDNASAYFNILRRGADTAIYNGSINGNSTAVTLTSGGDWVVQVYLMRNAARRGEAANYRLSISIEGRGSAAQLPTGSGDAAASGPDWWQVTGVGADDALNVRQGPSVNDRVIARVANGTILRNGGCVGEARTRWCKVSAPDDSFTGWASGRFLRESGAPADAGGIAQALLAETCRAAVAEEFELPIRSLTAYPAEPAGRGFEVFVQSNVITQEFNCRFSARGRLVGID